MNRRRFFLSGASVSLAAIPAASAKEPPGEHDGKFVGQMKVMYYGGRRGWWVQWDGEKWERLTEYKGPYIAPKL
jgi:hypothetical protein